MDKRDQEFRRMMKSYQPQKAPLDFSKKVMEEIQLVESKNTEYKPVFGKWFIRVMVSGFAAIIIYAIFGIPGNAEPIQQPEIIGSLLDKLPKVEMTEVPQIGNQVGEFLGSIPSVVGFTLLAATLLLLLDILVLKKFRRSLTV